MESLVLPILKDFQPDLVINGAGQDNHFTDPLANMQVTAEGYARLTELLKPDIVVLEGGYAVEGALPYVNLGILLALAGLDYSHVIEPDLTRYNLSQNQAVTETIAYLIDSVGEQWAQRREADLEGIFGSGDFFQRNRMIYYDTAGITESQRSCIRLCSTCAGWERIETRSDRFREMTCAVLLPWNCCSKCRSEAEAEYEEAAFSRRFRKVALHDPQKDHFTELRK